MLLHLSGFYRKVKKARWVNFHKYSALISTAKTFDIWSKVPNYNKTAKTCPCKESKYTKDILQRRNRFNLQQHPGKRG